MVTLRITAASIVVSFLAFVPLLANAATATFFGPIVSPECNCPGQAPGWGCILQTIQNVMNLGISLSVIIATIIIAYAGFLWILSPSNAENVKKGRDLLTNAVIGMVIVLSAWLVVDFVMKTLYDSTSFGPWNAILLVQGNASSCLQAKAGTVASTNNVTSVAGSGVAASTTTSTLVTSAPTATTTSSGTSSTSTGTGTVTTSTSGTTSTGSTAGGRCSVITSGACSVANLQGAFGNNAADASSICNAESGGNPAILSGVDVLKSTGESFSVGLFQINLTQNKLYGCSGKTYDCPAAFSGRNANAKIVNRDLYNQCVSAAQSASCNISNAVRIFNIGSWNMWGANSVCKV